ncbi:MAG: hypothetical protein JXR48_10665, partial [Candidatus Delongbacteria bacterium]|nr:hypothetical protein [Candidatus Delongbacteria bacterium]
FGIQTYKNLRNAIQGLGLQAHHIIEQRLAAALGLNSNEMLSVALTKAEHQAFTNAWRALIPYGTNYDLLSPQKVWEVAQKVYAEYPALLEAARISLFGK